jgi:hypothetical protein
MVPRTDNGSQGRPYTWERMGRIGPSERFRIITPDGKRAYMVSLGNGFERCTCLGYRQYGRCRHLPAMRRALEREAFASHGDLDISWGAAPRSPRKPDTPDEETLMLRHACETALNTILRLRIADLRWHHHGDLLLEVDNELIPLLRNAIQRSRAAS